MKLLSHWPTVVVFVVLNACVPATSDEQASSDSTEVATDTTALAADEEVEEGGPIEEWEPVEEIEEDPADSGQYDEQLLKFFTAEQIPIIKAAKKQFKDIATAADMAAYFPSKLEEVTEIIDKQIETVTPTETSGDDSPASSWEWFWEYYPGFYGSVECSECSYSSKVSLDLLIEKATTTPEPEDDKFFDIVNKVYGDSFTLSGVIENTGGWYELAGCDFCAASLLGSGKRYDILQAIEGAGDNVRRYWQKEIDEYQQTAVQIGEDKFMNTKEDVLAELNNMLKSKVLTISQRTALTEYRREITAGELKYFECQTKDCDWPQY